MVIVLEWRTVSVNEKRDLSVRPEREGEARREEAERLLFRTVI